MAARCCGQLPPFGLDLCRSSYLFGEKKKKFWAEHQVLTMKPPAPSPAARDPGTEPPGELGVAAGCRVWGLRGWAPRRAVTRGIPPPPGPAAPRPCSGVPACPSGWPCARGDPAGRSHPESLAACLASRASPDRKFGQVQDKARWLEMLRKPTAILFFFFSFLAHHIDSVALEPCGSLTIPQHTAQRNERTGAGRRS